MRIFQIYYDAESRMALDQGFIPLDNTQNERPDWFEFWVIRNFLQNNALDPNSWYGFLSPNFTVKTKLNSQYVLTFLSALDPKYEVALFTSSPDLLAIHLNPFEHGEYAHPGLLRASQAFLDTTDYRVELQKLVTTLETSVFSNYIIAKPRFWCEWLKLANVFFDYVEGLEKNKSANVDHNLILQNTYYLKNNVQMKVFVQERFASLILSQGDFETYVPPIINEFQIYDMPGREILSTCENLKKSFVRTGNKEFLERFLKMRPQFLTSDLQKVLSRFMGYPVYLDGI